MVSGDKTVPASTRTKALTVCQRQRQLGLATRIVGCDVLDVLVKLTVLLHLETSRGRELLFNCHQSIWSCQTIRQILQRCRRRLLESL